MSRLSQVPPESDKSIQLVKLSLEPLIVAHSSELYPILSDMSLYEFTGGEPPASAEALAQIYRSRVKQQSQGREQIWLNWLVRERKRGEAIGYVQATIEEGQTLIAWVIGRKWQKLGYGSEAAIGLTTWLEGCDLPPLRARINPKHIASREVAKRAGFSFLGEYFEKEEVWSR